MARTIIIKLLGGRIAFNALSNKLYALWKLNKLIQVMVLENDFYLVKFHDDDDYSKVLTDGPWVVFKHYLYVHPCFPSSQHHKYSLTNMVVWVRLPGPPKGLYSKSLLMIIGGAINLVVKIDHNIQYKSVPAVYFGFGHCGRNKELCLHKMPTSDKSSVCLPPVRLKTAVAVRLVTVAVRLETIVECVFGFKRSCSGE
ncbi:hypothetical protein Godav_010581, partial [Gossypium davidsonii]|nr:hypothetical protein [Gossypium davidsonii]